jgi:hypothetical protein
MQIQAVKHNRSCLMPTTFPILAALAAGLAVNVLDIACTLAFAAKPWEAELRRQGIEPRKWTPPYYIATNFVGGGLLTYLYLQLAASMGTGAQVALIASALIWLVSRLYGGGHVVMGQMPMRLFAIMSTGLGLGYLAGGQVLRWMLGP